MTGEDPGRTLGILVGASLGLWWGVAVAAALPLSFLASVKIVEVQANMTVATLTNLRLSRFSEEVEALRAVRDHLATQVRDAADKYADPSVPRMFSRGDLD